MKASGVNFFDTAEQYGGGACEECMGRAFKEMNEETPFNRKDIVVSTKLYWAAGEGQNRIGLSRKHVIEGMRNSLKRLQLENVDIVFAHRPDYDTPLEEQVRAFSWLVDQGMTRYWGTSEWPANVIEQACQIAERLGLHGPTAEQCQYNMLKRDRMEVEYKTLFDARGMGTTIWSPLAVGLLTGRYNDGEIPEGRIKEFCNTDMGKRKFASFFSEEGIIETKRCLSGLATIAKDMGVTQP